ncbi:class F sortase [Tepidiforma thermophila]|uniref:Sortase family protein n=1 Tax=Tepidiforma thermophila (strain KCTC 52669 / CGMCC 1.13589 / G233) TaxID=2761530 RepID=A0A2A9HH39_TEPT2|nr:class F sortase [Tepidiforma thermophila]PFG75128.1 sortase family protein [Tepidiforma thermophila]
MNAARLAHAALLLSVLIGGVAAAAASAQDPAALLPRAVLPNIAAGDLTPTPTPVPPFAGQVAALVVPAAGVDGRFPIEQRDTAIVAGREAFEDPSRPDAIAWYPRFGRPGFPGGNSIFAAHIDYVGYGPGPFARLTSVRPGDSVSLVMENGLVVTYTVVSVDVVRLADLDMDAVVFPPLPPDRERVTLISCGGTFIPRPGGGEYDSRVILVAERTVPR